MNGANECDGSNDMQFIDPKLKRICKKCGQEFVPAWFKENPDTQFCEGCRYE